MPAVGAARLPAEARSVVPVRRRRRRVLLVDEIVEGRVRARRGGCGKLGIIGTISILDTFGALHPFAREFDGGERSNEPIEDVRLALDLVPKRPPPRRVRPRGRSPRVDPPRSDLERFDKDARELGALAQSSRTFAAASFASRTASRTAA